MRSRSTSWLAHLSASLRRRFCPITPTATCRRNVTGFEPAGCVDAPGIWPVAKRLLLRLRTSTVVAAGDVLGHVSHFAVAAGQVADHRRFHRVGGILCDAIGTDCALGIGAGHRPRKGRAIAFAAAELALRAELDRDRFVRTDTAEIAGLYAAAALRLGAQRELRLRRQLRCRGCLQ